MNVLVAKSGTLDTLSGSVFLSHFTSHPPHPVSRRDQSGGEMYGQQHRQARQPQALIVGGALTWSWCDTEVGWCFCLTQNIPHHTSVETLMVLIHTLDNMSVRVPSSGTLDFLSLAPIYPNIIPVYERYHTLWHVDLTLEVCWLSWIFGLVHHGILNLRRATSVHFPHIF